MPLALHCWVPPLKQEQKFRPPVMAEPIHMILRSHRPQWTKVLLRQAPSQPTARKMIRTRQTVRRQDCSATDTSRALLCESRRRRGRRRKGGRQRHCCTRRSPALCTACCRRLIFRRGHPMRMLRMPAVSLLHVSMLQQPNARTGLICRLHLAL